MYKGEWKDDMYHGQGTESWNNNTMSYTGQFENGGKAGRGRIQMGSSHYQGQFKDGKMHGQGEFYFADSDK